MPEFEYDVLLSYPALDEPIAMALAERLKAEGLRVASINEWEGQGPIRHFRDDSRFHQTGFLFVLNSRHGTGLEEVSRGMLIEPFLRVENPSRYLIVLNIDGTEAPEYVNPHTFLDWSKPTDAEFTNLLTCLRQQGLHGHESYVRAVAISDDGLRAISGSGDDTLRVWDLTTGNCLATLEGHTDSVKSVSVTPDGLLAVSGSSDNSLRVWDLMTCECLSTLYGHTGSVNSVSVTPDGHRAVSGSYDGTLRVWDLTTGDCLAMFEGLEGYILSVSVTLGGLRAISGSYNGKLRILDLTTGSFLATLGGHTGSVYSVSATPDGRRAVSGSDDRTLRVWDLTTGDCLATLEGHKDSVNSVSVTPDGLRAISGSTDGTLRVWDLTAGECLATLVGHKYSVGSVSVTPDGRRAISASDDGTLRVWDLSELIASSTNQSRYTNAKILLTGESGVGKTALSMRLVHDSFEPTVSTDGVWATQLKLPDDNKAPHGVEREVWLWDFAGQADYRLIHQLYMDETAVALFVFNPQSDNPFEGLGQWDRDLSRAAGGKPFRKLLVAGRCDRGGLRVSQALVDTFWKERQFHGYHETSANTGTGCKELREAILDAIPWDSLPYTSSPKIFKRIKEESLKLKDEGRVLLRMAELKETLARRMPGEPFTTDDLTTVVRLLAGAGVVWKLDFGEYVLLQPERVNAYAAALVRKVRKHIDEIGCISEADVLAGRLEYEGMTRLDEADESIVLRAMLETLVKRGLCLKEEHDSDSMLVFPSYFRRERPDQNKHPAEYVRYRFVGSLDEIYTTLVVRLHHTRAFDKDQLYRDAADFKNLGDDRCLGLKLTRKAESTGEITLYFDPQISDGVKVIFMRYVHDHLHGAHRASEIERTRFFVCPQCGTAVENHATVRKKIAEGKPDILCVNCEGRVPLFDAIEKLFASEAVKQKSREMDRQAQETLDNESLELILVGQAFSVAGEAGQIFRPTPNSDWGIDGEIEFKDHDGNASGERVYLQLKSGDSYLRERKRDHIDIFTIKKERQAKYWQQQRYPVMLVIRTSDEIIRWMDISKYLKENRVEGATVKQVEFRGEPFTADSLRKLRDELIPPVKG